MKPESLKGALKSIRLWTGTDYRRQTRYAWSYDAYPIVEEQREDAFSRIDRIKNSVGVSEAESLYLQGKNKL